MEFSQLLIIYIACGVPFGIHYFVENNKETNHRIIAKSALVSFLWFLYVFVILFRKKPSKNLFSEEKISKIQKQICETIRDDFKHINYLQAREIIQRYVALALAQNDNSLQKTDLELLKISRHPKPLIGVKCLQRRDNKKIKSHLIFARKQFLELIFKCNTERVIGIAQDLVETLNDRDATLLIKKISESKSPAKTATEKNLKEAVPVR
ncbi:MAG: hypothetical protein D6687_10935 [Acidobacteria bacterium]|nr:MAG: hypothetical protein D6687_10935 [Acidobacteriota bacterium]